MNYQTQDNSASVTLGKLFPELSLPVTESRMSIRSVEIDSRKVEAGSLFIALKGQSFDAHDFIEDAIANGAIAVAIDASYKALSPSVQLSENTLVLFVESLAQRVSHIAGLCLGHPSQRMKTIGVTGTNGKSTCVALISQLANAVGQKSASLGTLGVSIGTEEPESFGMTTPDAVSCQKKLADLASQGVELVAMEVSSHGLAQNRVGAVRFDVGVFTNLTHEHLDFHGSVENYRKAKQKMFEFEGLKVAIINLDDPSSQHMLNAVKVQAEVQIYTYSLLHFIADIYVSEIEFNPHGVEFTMVSPWGTRIVKSPLLGQFNVYNLLASIAAVCSVGLSLDDVLSAVLQLKPVHGRMQRLAGISDISVVVDYAHTPDALEQAISATALHGEGRLCVVFGCGGDRDAFKRPMMAQVAESKADSVVVTSDNPRTEDPQAIVDDICKGFVANTHQVIVDRKEAIESTILNAKAGDRILIAGKGHETYQMVGDKKLPFSDFEVAGNALLLRKRNLIQGASI